MAREHVINLCESTLRSSTRDVYRHRLPSGSWTYSLQHEGQGRVDIQIRALDRGIARWSTLRVDEGPQSGSGNEKTGRFSTGQETDVRFIFSSSEAASDISYRCDLIPAEGTVSEMESAGKTPARGVDPDA